MAFKEMLKYAVQLGGEADAFAQAGPTCLAYVTKWMIDQILGRKFVARVTPASGTVLLTKNKIEELRLRRVRYHAESERLRKSTMKLQKKLNDGDELIGQHRGAQLLKSHLTNKGLPVEINTVRPAKNPIKHEEIQYSERDNDPSMPIAGIAYELPRHICTSGNKGYIISVRTERQKSASAPSYNHAMGAFTSGKWIRYFDPNMGEVRLPTILFYLWFRKYREAWKQHEKMGCIDSWYLSEVSSPSSIDGYIKGIANREFGNFFESCPTDLCADPFVYEAFSMVPVEYVVKLAEEKCAEEDPYAEFEEFKFEI